MNNGDKVTYKELVEAGWEDLGPGAGYTVFGKGIDRVAWDQRTETIKMVYNFPGHPVPAMAERVPSLSE